jgi:GNAT superfamily N-acetyltransferase
VNEGVEIRRATAGDLPGLIEFFVHAYGARTIFRDSGFLRWYLGPPDDMRSIIAVAPTGAIVGHYGALACQMLLDGRAVDMLWGVNAYTLPEFRGLGLGHKLFVPWLESAAMFGVIGFNARTAEFYERAGLQLFRRERFRRYARSFDARTSEVVERMGGDVERAREVLVENPSVSSRASRAIRDDADAIARVQWDHPPCALTAFRSPARLRWRYIEQSWLAYELATIVVDSAARAYVVTRRTPLEPTQYTATRIVDAFGDDDSLVDLFAYVSRRAAERGDLWIDFVATGRKLAAIDALEFVTLQDEDFGLLPQVTSPIQLRGNHEYVGIFSRDHAARVRELAFDDVYLTRADSDRDRVARIANEIKEQA